MTIKPHTLTLEMVAAGRAVFEQRCAEAFRGARPSVAYCEAAAIATFAAMESARTPPLDGDVVERNPPNGNTTGKDVAGMVDIDGTIATLDALSDRQRHERGDKFFTGIADPELTLAKVTLRKARDLLLTLEAERNRAVEALEYYADREGGLVARQLLSTRAYAALAGLCTISREG